MEHRKADIRQVAGHTASGDDASRFLRELRQLRAGAGLGHAELAARAHYPYDRIKAAEVGPSLPDLPVLSAFVRGCGGTTDEWEERWRSLTRTPSLPVPATRQTGNSAASDAGARIGAANQGTGAPDPSIIRAALSRVAEGMAGGADPTSTPSPTIEPPAAVPAPAPPAVPAVPAPASADTAWPQDKPSGWDPIRVSNAWPVLGPDSYQGTETTEAKDTRADSAAGNGTATGAESREAAPWAPAPWAGNRKPDLAAASPGAPASGVTPGVPAPAATPTAWAPAAHGVPVASGNAAPSAAGSQQTPVMTAGGGGTGLTSSRARLIVLAAVLLCVLAVVLAVFA